MSQLVKITMFVAIIQTELTSSRFPALSTIHERLMNPLKKKILELIKKKKKHKRYNLHSSWQILKLHDL